jgi:transcription initiation factor TFIID TATA-box-binding protein
MIMQGAKDDRTGNLGCRKVAKILERLGHNVSVVLSKNRFN